MHAGLFVLTFATTTLAGVQWLNLSPFALENFGKGLLFSVGVCSILLSHEFGHYFAAQYHGVDTTYPFFIPFPGFLFDGLLSFGTLGAVIRIRSRVPSRKALLAIGAAGPIAGFVVSLALLIIGYATLPPIAYLYTIHPEYLKLDHIPEGGLAFGSNLLLALLQSTIPSHGSFVPPMNEIYHYPLLSAGWFGLFLTAMNLLPVGELDGGHVAKAILGEHAKKLQAPIIISLTVLGALGFAPFAGIDIQCGWAGWIFWAAILFYLARRSRRMSTSWYPDDSPKGLYLLAGIVCLVILLVTFFPTPFSLY